MQRISVFDMLKIGIGPSSSHTMGPWRAMQRFLRELKEVGQFDAVEHITVELFGSLAKTGKGHGTNLAVIAGLCGENPATCDISRLQEKVARVRTEEKIHLLGELEIPFDPASDLIFHFDQSLEFHPNGIRVSARLSDGEQISEEYFSIGGGFIVKAGERETDTGGTLPYPFHSAADVVDHCRTNNFMLWQLVLHNELTWRTEEAIHTDLLRTWDVMADSIYRGCHTSGELPGGLNVVRRAPQLQQKLIGNASYSNREEWQEHIRSQIYTFQEMVRWISCFALAVNEENASFGRVVTAPTNGAAGVIPAVLMHYVCNYDATDDEIVQFLSVAGLVGILFKTGATISAAMGGCQAEIGVSSAMAAAALTEGLGGSVEQSLMAAEIAMEHHLGLTCDPVGGLVQIPCIERNAMGAVKAITASSIALESSPESARVSLDEVIRTMWETAQDMNQKYKETSEGGLALTIPVNVIEC